MDYLTAVNTIARHIVATALHGSIFWEDYPEIGEQDWEAVAQEAARLAANFEPPLAAHRQAYKFLVARASTED